MTPVAVDVRVEGATLNEKSFRSVLPGAAKALDMTAWTIHPGGATLTVGRNVALHALDAVVWRMAREIGGVAERNGLDGYRIVAGQGRAAA